MVTEGLIRIEGTALGEDAGILGAAVLKCEKFVHT